ncbi:unnamed protein product [Rotaria sordida]|uniref:Uncharacterized protein n=1 Tax=Rotaria sordida TaxID=392033 RepID=A0A818ISQ3_9BILA|nr:unnamed protein product [Rotaria sordida]
MNIQRHRPPPQQQQPQAPPPHQIKRRRGEGDGPTTATTNDILKLIQGDSNIELVYTRTEHSGTLILVVGTIVRKRFQVTTLKRSIIRHDVPDEKIWIELELILRSHFAGHIITTVLERQLASNLGLPESSIEMFELDNRWLRCMKYQPESMILFTAIFNDQKGFDTFYTHVKCSTRYKNLSQFLLDYRYLISSINKNELLHFYKEFIINSHQTQ